MRIVRDGVWMLLACDMCGHVVARWADDLMLLDDEVQSLAALHIEDHARAFNAQLEQLPSAP